MLSLLRVYYIYGKMLLFGLIAESLTIFLLSVVERQRRCHEKFHDLVHEIIKGNIELFIISLDIS